ncbi:MAG: phosphodiester glycosidase family protein [Limnospira sp.]
MSQSAKSGGCRKMVRRTFLVLVGIGLFRILKAVFSIPENRTRAIAFIDPYLQEYFPWLSARLQSADAPVPQPTIKPLPNAPIPEAEPLPAAPIPKATPQPTPESVSGNPVIVTQKQLLGVPFYQTAIDLRDSQTLLTIGLANNAKQANSNKSSQGDEPFENMVKRHPAAVVANGTFFSKDDEKRVMGNMVAAGQFLKYSRWENFGTTLGLREGNRPEMITARAQGKPEWDQHWFSITCGPRLVKGGKIWLAPKTEGFKDPHVLDVGYRTAIGFTEDGNQLFLVSFLASLSLQKEAEVMKALGCYEAMNLDGGASEALAYQNQVLVSPGRNLTNVIIVYDRNFPAPQEVQTAWGKFQNGDRPKIPG